MPLTLLLLSVLSNTVSVPPLSIAPPSIARLPATVLRLNVSAALEKSLLTAPPNLSERLLSSMLRLMTAIPAFSIAPPSCPKLFASTLSDRVSCPSLTIAPPPPPPLPCWIVRLVRVTETLGVMTKALYRLLASTTVTPAPSPTMVTVLLTTRLPPASLRKPADGTFSANSPAGRWMMAPPACRLAFISAARRVQVVLATFVRQVSKLGSPVKSAGWSVRLLTVNVTGPAAGAASAPAGARPGAAALDSDRTHSASAARKQKRTPPVMQPAFRGRAAWHAREFRCLSAALATD